MAVALQRPTPIPRRNGMSGFWFDLRVAVRTLRKSPGFSLAVIAALALGIGPNTAIFSIVHATLLAPMSYPQPEQLVRVWSQLRGGRAGTSPPEYREWKEQATSFQFLEAWEARELNLSTSEAPERVTTRLVTPDGYRIYGEGVWLGRDFRPDEDQPGKNQVALMSNRLWRRAFGADPNILGRTIRLDGKPYTVIAVLPPGKQDRRPAELWIPQSFTAEESSNRQYQPLSVTGRLKPGVTRAQAQQEMKVIAARQAQQFPDDSKGRSVTVEPMQNNLLRPAVARNLWLLLAAVSFVMLIACLNVASLLLSRGLSRQREAAIRGALGASRGRLARHAFLESLLLSLLGGALGTLASVWILQGILALLPRGMLPSEADPRLNLPVLLFTVTTAIAAGLLVGSAQAWQASRVDLTKRLKQDGPTTTASGGRGLRRLLVVGEFALALTLLAGAGLTIQSFWNRISSDLGVRTDNILTFALPLHRDRFDSPGEIAGFYQQLVEKLQTVPGVLHASISAPDVPLRGGGMIRTFIVVGQPDATPSLRPNTGTHQVSPEYFQIFQPRLVHGRVLTAADGPNTERVAVVNQRFADLYLSGRDPLGQRLLLDEPGAGSRGPGRFEWQVVGVIGDVGTYINSDRFGDPRQPQVYLPFAQSPEAKTMMAVRAAGSPEGMRRSLASAVQSVDANLPLMNVQTMEQIVGLGLAPDRLNVALYSGLAALALLLAALGIYGVLAFMIVQRTREIGLRMALGARQAQVRLQILHEGVTLAAGGLVLGLAGAYLLGRAMQSTLYGTGAISLPVLLAAGVLLLGAALLACYLPARRASRVDPMIALRDG
jgi:putative ABC transport system permease protein